MRFDQPAFIINSRCRDVKLRIEELVADHIRSCLIGSEIKCIVIQ